MSLIDRGRVMIDYLENLGRNDSYKAKYEALSKAVDEAPAVDAEPVVHGRWISGRGSWSTENCSVCGWKIPYSEDSYLGEMNYCPTCGAKMDLEE